MRLKHTGTPRPESQKMDLLSEIPVHMGPHFWDSRSGTNKGDKDQNT